MHKKSAFASSAKKLFFPHSSCMKPLGRMIPFSPPPRIDRPVFLFEKIVAENRFPSLGQALPPGCTDGTHTEHSFANRGFVTNSQRNDQPFRRCPFFLGAHVASDPFMGKGRWGRGFCFFSNPPFPDQRRRVATGPRLSFSCVPPYAGDPLSQ